MAEIKPFRAWRYNPELSQQIDALTSPLFDVVSEKQRNALYKNPYNSIHLSVPRGDSANDDAAKTLKEWKEQQVIKQDKLAGIYVYYQYFTLAGHQKEFVRKGFICNMRTYDWEDKVILRHENTIPKAVNDRAVLLEKTNLHVSPTHGLYSDPTFELEKFMDESMENPIYETEDYQGVRDVLSVIHDLDIIKRFQALLEAKQVILADGHHRYEGSLAYKRKHMASNAAHTGSEGYNFHLMFFTNMEADDLRILPTHRIIKNLENFSEPDLLAALEKDFIIKNVENVNDIHEIILGKKWAFGLVTKENAYKIRLKPEVLSTMAWNFPPDIKALDLTVLHYFVIEKVLGISGKHQRNSEKVTFERSFAECLTEVLKEEAQFALITQEISMEEIKKVCFSGFMMPQKSTYFYPKVICGFLFSSIQENEFQPTDHSCF